MDLRNEWMQQEAEQVDEETNHRSPDEEIAFFQAVCDGNIEEVRKNCSEKRFLANEGVGRLSVNPVTNLKYHFVITAALLARTCTEAGLEHEKSFRLSDFYIGRLDELKTSSQINALHDRMVMDYTGRMKILRYSRAASRPVNDSLNYIYIHINSRLTLEEIAEAVHVSPSYLSRTFKKELGLSVSDYIRDKKIDLAANYLKYSNYDLAEIAGRLCFSSQSHFIQAFKSATGMTPKKYRDMHGRKSWNVGAQS